MNEEYIAGRNPVIEALKSSGISIKSSLLKARKKDRCSKLSVWPKSAMFLFNMYRKKKLTS